MGEGSQSIDWISNCYDEFLTRIFMCTVWRLHWVMSFGYPNEIVVTAGSFSNQAIKLDILCEFDKHVTACVDACNLLYKSAQESVPSARKR